MRPRIYIRGHVCPSFCCHCVENNSSVALLSLPSLILHRRWVWSTHTKPDAEAQLIPLLEIAYDTKKAFLVYAIVASVVTVILLIVFIVLRKSIALCVELFMQVRRCGRRHSLN